MMMMLGGWGVMIWFEGLASPASSNCIGLVYIGKPGTGYGMVMRRRMRKVMMMIAPQTKHAYARSYSWWIVYTG